MVRRLRPSEALRRLDIIAERRAQARRRRLAGPFGDLLSPPAGGQPAEGADPQDPGPDADAPGTSS